MATGAPSHPPHYMAHGCGHQIYRIWGPVGSDGGPLGPLGLRGPHGNPNPMLWVQYKFENLPKICIWAFLGSKMGEQKVGIQDPGPPRRDSGRNSASNPGPNVKNGRMATPLVTKRCDLGYLGVPGPASTPLAPMGVMS